MVGGVLWYLLDFCYISPASYTSTHKNYAKMEGLAPDEKANKIRGFKAYVHENKQL